MKLVLFDCDGTLVDSVALIHETMRRTFRAFEKPDPQEMATRAIIGLTLDIAIAHMLGRDHADEECVRMMAHYKSLFGTVRAEGFQEPLFPRVSEVLETLHAQDDVILGAVTGKSRRGLDMICSTHGFEKLFFVSRTADDCPSKPHPAMVTECCYQAGINPADTVVIGDARYDMEMAKAAGARAIGVSWGYGSLEELKLTGADLIAENVAELPTLIEQVLNHA
ncbi:HAD-IA family hydrolase [Rhizobium sp. L1K21]|uniref:HAD-IA family hydrolase n=1 Tax=Rhizobium sp. L1K21 TaxID=2954933 RepID=UPI002093F348|nr:HAD-IA family hydrolase [Rhizobium sp. L1K21]MCO6186167.1 HAD-IA family hydrolase [Rhizobium sp. L1K21]